MLATVGLAGLLAWRSLRHHRVVALATILGVAIGMTVVCAVLIVDNNTRAVDIPAPVEEIFGSAKSGFRQAYRATSWYSCHQYCAPG